MAKSFAAELAENGVNMTPHGFERLLDSVFRSHCPGRRVEWLLMNPTDPAGSVGFVAKVRHALIAEGVMAPGRIAGEDFILRKLSNLRKGGRSPEKPRPGRRK